VSKLK